MSNNNQELDFSSFNIFNDFSDSVEDLIDAQEGPTLDILEFIDQELDLGIELTFQQNLVLKCVYGLELNSKELEQLEDWRYADRTTWEIGQSYNYVVLECGRRGGKCVDIHDSYIFSDKGIVKLDELDYVSNQGQWFEANYTVSSGTNRYSKSDKFFYNGVKPVTKITTQLGYDLTGVNDHKIKVLDNSGNLSWKKIEEIQKGDYLALSKCPNIWSQEYFDFHLIERQSCIYKNYTDIKYLNENLAYILGLIVGKGNWHGNYVEVFGLDDELETYYKIITDSFPNFDSRIVKRKDNVQYLRIGNVNLLVAFQHLGYKLNENNEKRIPYSIMQSPRSVGVEFLRGLFDTKGYVSIKGNEISIATYSSQLIKQTQLLLLNLGIITDLKKRKGSKNRIYYYLRIKGKGGRERFSRIIGFRVNRKSSRLQSRCDYELEDNKNHKIPNQYEKVLELTNKYKDLKKLVGVRDCISYSNLKDITNWLKANNLEEEEQHFIELEELDYLYDYVDDLESYSAETGDLSIPTDKTYVVNGVVSHNSSLSAVISTYEFYKLCKLESPQLHYKIATSTPISILVIATTAEQTKTVTFAGIVGCIENCKYFKRLYESGLLTIGVERISHKTKRVSIISGNSKSSSQVGGTVKTLVLDEVARFQDKDEHSNALEIWSNIGAALTTFKENALVFGISSAWEQDDAIQVLYERSKKSSNYLGFRLRSKDLNPIHGGDDNPFVKGMLETDPERAYLEFYGIRPAISDAYLNEREIERALRGDNQIIVEPYTNTLPNKQKLSCLRLIDIRTTHTEGNIVHLDPGLKQDFYGCAWGHAEFEDEQLIVVIDSIFCWEGSREANASISNVYEVLMQLNNQLPIEYLSADQWNSAETLQKFQMAGIKAEEINFTSNTQLKIYGALKQLLMEDRIILPSNSKWSPLLERELKQLQLQNGKKIDHPKGNNGSKDLADCIAAVAYKLNQRTFVDKTNYGDNNFAKLSSQRVNFNRRTQAVEKAYSRRDWIRQQLKDTKY